MQLMHISANGTRDLLPFTGIDIVKQLQCNRMCSSDGYLPESRKTVRQRILPCCVFRAMSHGLMQVSSCRAGDEVAYDACIERTHLDSDDKQWA
uniref:Uncharacterized protein n=1 Tax=Hyaloperonospora arabidopsidis (strain Emoy2) TaxID=559515 RepID=M4BJZ6_HYAAE